MGLRKNYKFMSDDQRTRFVNALKTLKQKGVVENFAQIHATYFYSGIHVTSHFLPWHREMLYRFELELQKVDSSVTIPYWESPLDNNTLDKYFWTRSDFLGPFNTTWQLGRALGSGTLPTWTNVQDVQNRTTYDTYWWGTDANGEDGLQYLIHNPPHQWVGGEMASTTSPRDPAFYLHHCWIDMLWALWQRRHPKAPFVPSPDWGTGVNRRKWGVYDPLLAWPDRTPADVLDHRNQLGYRYDTEYDLRAGDVLYLNDIQYSPSRQYALWFTSGRLSLNRPDGSGVWWSTKDPTPGTRCVMNGDGNLIISDNFGQPRWTSDTAGHDGARLWIQDPAPEIPEDTGHMGIYDIYGNPLWPNPWSRPPPSVG